MSYMYFKMGTMVITKKPIMESTDEHIYKETQAIYIPSPSSLYQY